MKLELIEVQRPDQDTFIATFVARVSREEFEHLKTEYEVQQ